MEKSQKKKDKKIMGKKSQKKKGKKIVLEVKKLSKEVCLPEYIMGSDIGLDLRANENANLMPMEQKTIKTGLVIKIPDGHVGLIRDRAGIVTKMGVHTAAGTFDPSYRGEISVVLVNFGDGDATIEKGMRVAQLLILPIVKVEVKEAKDLSATERGDKGFGSTGIKEKMEELKKLTKEIKQVTKS